MTVSDNPEDVTPDDCEEPEGWDSPGSWEQLLYAIKWKQCTPFLGAGACAGVLPLGKSLARDWAKQYDFPFSDSDNLPRVAQFVSIMKGALLPRHKIREEFDGKLPDFDQPDEPHRVVAELGLPVYITTNYDNFMINVLESLGKHPIQEYCRWHQVKPSQTKNKGTGSVFTPTPEQPVVFHLHGCLHDLNSMVLTEDDYLNFLIRFSEGDVIPSYIETAFGSDNAFLFIGYSLEDMSFKVLFRKVAQQIASSPGDRHVAVQLHNTEGITEGEKKKQRKYLQELFRSQNVRVYWGTARCFARNLRKRWEEFK